MKNKYAIIHTNVLFGGLCIAAFGTLAASVYLWTDQDGRIHIADEPPVNGGMVRNIIEYEPGSGPPPAWPSPRSDAAEAENRDKTAQCRNVREARRTLRKTKSVAVAVRQRASEARDELQDLRRRIGFDDDRRDDFKDDLKRLEENARRTEMFAQQAELDVQVSGLQLKMAELDAGEPCAGKDRFY